MSARPNAALSLRFAVATLLALTLALALALPAPAADELGIFWDTNYVLTNTEASPGEVVTGYLVLKDCSSASGVLGWECKILQDGPGTFVGVTPEGQAINVGTMPEIQVGIGGDPLPVTADGVLLATFQFLYPESLPVFFGLTNLYRPSVAGEMSYIPADEPETLRPMYPLGNPEEVASINGNVPMPILEPAGLNFGEIPVGGAREDHVRITNAGGGTLMIAPAVEAGCLPFTLVSDPGPYYLARNQSVDLTVRFAPTEVGQFTCSLELGPGAPDLPLGGSGREPFTSYTVSPTAVDFGSVVIGRSRTSTIYLHNTGEAGIPLTAVLVDSVPGLTVEVPPEPVMPPGAAWALDLTFAPVSALPFDTVLDLGDILPDIPVTGTGREPRTLWDLDPEHVAFVDVDAGVTEWRTLRVHNAGDTVIPLDASIETPDGLFGVDPTGPSDLLPGEFRYYNIRFMSELPGDFSNNLLLGEVIPPVPITANVPYGDEACLITPPEIDFGTITVGETYTIEFNITNQQAAPMDVAPRDYGGSLVVLGDPAVLDFGETATYRARFTPAAEGRHDGVITVGGDYCADIPWTALAVEPSCLAGPNPVEFGVVAVGQVHARPLAVQNPFTAPITLTPVSDDPAFTVTETSVTLQPGDIVSLELLFAPTEVGSYAASIDLGLEGCETVEVTGTAALPECQVSASVLDFGTVVIGNALERFVYVTNVGVAAVSLTPATSGPAFSVDGQAGSLDPGESRAFAVVFHPTATGSVQGSLTFGTDACPTVTLLGEGESPVLVGDNLIGIYFDPGSYLFNEWTVPAGIPEPVTFYLVLKDSSDLAGVSAWECAFEIEGNAFAVDWQVEGNAVNVGSGGEFIVGLAQPLPWSPGILLATGTILAQLGSSESALLQLHPIQDPSLPGEMAWIGGTTPGLLIPMGTTTGQPTVAIITSSSATPVEMPAPRADLAGGQVRLSWTLSGDTGDGCNVYRRGPDGRHERLTAVPVAASGSRFEYLDQPFGFPANTTLAYSYTKVTNGIEGPRSLETEVLLTNLPAVRTRLLANVPNPFNPSTEIHFELQQAGRARVAIYAMDGRLVRTVVDDALAAGPHHRLWDGRDDTGRQASSGAYYLRLETADAVDHRKMMLLK